MNIPTASSGACSRRKCRRAGEKCHKAIATAMAATTLASTAYAPTIPHIDCRISSGMNPPLIADEFALFHVQAAIGAIEIALVVRHGNDGNAALFEHGEELGVELSPEDRILISGPFVQHANWTSFKNSNDQ